MIDNSTLKFKLENQLAKLKLSEEEKEKLIAELNFLSNLLIDVYLAKKGNEQ